MIAGAAAGETKSSGQDRARSRRDPDPGSWRDELNDFLRAFSGGFIVATPLLYTMEVWWIGATVELWKPLVFLAVAFLIGLGLARSESGGFKDRTDHFATIEQAVDVLAVGIVGSAAVLAVLGRISLDAPPDVVVGRIVVQAAPFAIGASVANAIFGSHGDRSRQGNDNGEPETAWEALRADVGATIVGAIFLSFAIAPTGEVPMLAGGLDYVHTLALVGFSLLVSFVIVFASGYGEGQHEQPGPFQSPLTETALAYAVSLLVAFAALHLFDRIEPGAPFGQVVDMVLVLGLPATIGGAAGRLVV